MTDRIEQVAGDRPVVVITGAGGRLGSAIAMACARRGVALGLVDRAGAPLDEVAARVGSLGVPAEILVADVTEEGAADAALARVAAVLGRFDALVNGAGVEGPVGRIEDISLDAVRAVFDVNVMALLDWTQAAIRRFPADRGGRIVNLASGAGLAGSGHMAPYSASKHAVIGLTRSIAGEVAGRGISINAVCPGCVESPMMDRIEERLGELTSSPVSFLSSVPMGRYCHPDEVGEFVAYLALEAPAYMTGAAIVIDGGMRA